MQTAERFQEDLGIIKGIASNRYQSSTKNMEFYGKKVSSPKFIN